jgi:drug/metabolite transporter (DMT)-like permease
LRTIEHSRFSPSRNRQEKTVQTAWGLFFGLIVAIAGAVFLYNGMSNADVIQSTAIVGGATLLSLGSAVMLILLKNWWNRKREYRRY